MNTHRTVVVAIGGNALVRQDQRGTFEEQSANVQESVDTLAELVRQGYRLVITHGNGPQVGSLYLRTDIEGEPLTAMPLDVCGAETQGQIGYVIEMALANKLRQFGLTTPVVTVITRVEVDADDPNFTNSTKPVGPFYTQAELEAAMRFASQGKGCAVITTLSGASEALSGLTGTRIVPDSFYSKHLVTECPRELCGENAAG